MRAVLVLGALLFSLPALAQPAQPQMPPPPATQATPTAPTSVKPVTVKPTVKGTKVKSDKSSNCRDATSGKFVTAAYAKKNPTTTVCETTK